MQINREVTRTALSTRFKIFQSLPLLGAVLFIFSSSFPPLDLLAQINLPAHMGQHALIALSGILISYPLYLKRRSIGKTPPKNWAVSSIFVIAAIVVAWHQPVAWDAAVLNPVVHGFEHFSFLSVGLLVGFFFPTLPDNFKFMSIFLAASGHMIYGIYLFIMNTPVYPLYPVSQQNLLAILMLFPAPLYFIGGIVFSLHRETAKIEELGGFYFEGEDLIHSNKARLRRARRSGLSTSSIAVSTATILLLVLFIGYLVLTAGVIYSSSAADPPSVNQTRILILETPVTWQYSPQNVVVVVGVNNTVTWISHSFSEDTVTGDSGLFNSGVLAPGQSWSYTFTEPGIYNYYCAFHPWMKGSITVIAR